MDHITEHTIRLAKARLAVRDLLDPQTDDERAAVGWLVRIGETHVLENIAEMIRRNQHEAEF